MKTPTLRFLFDARNTATREKAASVVLVVTFDRKRKYINTGVRLFSGQWDDKKRVIRRNDCIELNERLTAIERLVEDYITESIKDGRRFDLGDIDRYLAEAEGKNETFIEYIRRRIAERGDIRESTKRQHLTLAASLDNFGGIRHFHDLTKTNISRYYDWLHTQGISQPTIYNYIKRLKVYIHDAMRNGLVGSDPTDGMRFKRGKSTQRRYLAESDIRKLAETEFSQPFLEKARDLFLFQCYTGLAYADLAKFDFEHDVTERNGRFVIADRRKKTDEDYFIVLLKPAMAILRKYGFSMPVSGNQQYNRHLKFIAALCGLEINLTSHVARHSFAVFALNNGVPIEVVAKMMGHTDIKTTQIYAKILNKEVEKGFDVLESKLK